MPDREARPNQSVGEPRGPPGQRHVRPLRRPYPCAHGRSGADSRPVGGLPDGRLRRTPWGARLRAAPADLRERLPHLRVEPHRGPGSGPRRRPGRHRLAPGHPRHPAPCPGRVRGGRPRRVRRLTHRSAPGLLPAEPAGQCWCGAGVGHLDLGQAPLPGPGRRWADPLVGLAHRPGDARRVLPGELDLGGVLPGARGRDDPAVARGNDRCPRPGQGGAGVADGAGGDLAVLVGRRAGPSGTPPSAGERRGHARARRPLGTALSSSPVAEQGLFPLSREQRAPGRPPRRGIRRPGKRVRGGLAQRVGPRRPAPTQRAQGPWPARTRGRRRPSTAAASPG